jgi:hypothetical protein
LLVSVVSNKATLAEGEHRLTRYDLDVKFYPDITIKEDGSGGRREGTGVTEDNAVL